MSTTLSDRLRELIEPLVSSQELDLEEVTVTPAGKRRVLRVVVDSDDGVQLDTCADLSRSISARLDETDLMGEGEYVLEVTSPGADRPLSEYRHYVRATGRLVKFHLTPDAGAEELVARIEAVDEDGLDLEVPGVKGRKPKQRRLPLKDIARARVEIEFNRKNASADRTQNEEEA
ncbi:MULTISPECIES: ribosome maturation factor RimP [Streptomyces]|uniref:Ribosome maturation factor RimP n=1 Tax=Streptomyces odorifer TaxID=53450 RepID=A0A7Y6CAB6_9ACTN|nr:MULTISPECIES: ribosome maturation factor RimP [Streptomyces]MBZ2407517.1 ribosome maturation factor RimP [Streptomyces sp. L06]NUV35927.1 ribosome maturation factor RimP [Streptomyces sp. KAI-27]NUV46678.1 ribosome maturation factor RimP [Streptomyces sp. CAI-78]KLI99493.1 ribosome maturation protein RimP [Streptomyces sp. KE1]MBL0781210.1 ribosome maturation factor RimP [Streptomyces albidoflavus]